MPKISYKESFSEDISMFENRTKEDWDQSTSGRFRRYSGGLVCQLEGYHIYSPNEFESCPAGFLRMTAERAIFYSPLASAGIGPCQVTWLIKTSTDHKLKLSIDYVYIEISVSCDRSYADRIEIFDSGDDESRKLLMRLTCGNYIDGMKGYESDWNTMMVAWKSPQAMVGSQPLMNKLLARYQREKMNNTGRDVVSNGCITNWLRYGSRCYNMISTPKHVTWLEAEQICLEKSGHLLRIDNEQHMKFVHENLFSTWLKKDMPEHIYIGLVDGVRAADTGNGLKGKQSVFRWTDSRPMAFSQWARGQPNGTYSEDCTMIRLKRRASTRNWHDIPCNQKITKTFICQSDAQPFQAAPSLTWPSSSEDCPPQFYQCGNGECLHPDWRCDSQVQCQDGSDELDCPVEGCTWYQFQCDSGQCIPMSGYCDHRRQCADDSDEAQCIWPTCTEDEFKCHNGECIATTLVNDFTKDCLDGSDEIGTNRCDEFQCYDGECLPNILRCDGVKDCAGIFAEDEQNCQITTSNSSLLCNNGISYEAEYRCVLTYKSGFLMGCRDASHLNECEDFQCQEDHVKCGDAYCISAWRICDRHVDCPNGEDEQECANYQCPGGLRCKVDGHCLPSSSLICDGIKQCEGGLDEDLCWECPDQCNCHGQSADCSQANLAKFPVIPQQLRKLIARRNAIQSFNLFLPFLGELDLSSNLLKNLSSSLFFGLRNLYSLNIGDNLFEVLENDVFMHLINLNNIVLVDNVHLRVIESNAFKLLEGTSRLKHLNLSGLDLTTIKDDAFMGLSQLQKLDISSNALEFLYTDVFEGLDDLVEISIQNNPLGRGRTSAFEPLKSLKILHSDSFHFCCMVEWVSKENCFPQADAFVSCTDLLRSDLLRIFQWTLGGFATLGNILALIVRFLSSGPKTANTTIIFSLCYADLLMGVYLLIVGAADQTYQGEYIFHDLAWRKSVWCNVAGVLSTVSSEVSLAMILLLSFDRYQAIAHPFRDSKNAQLFSLATTTLSWLIFVTIALVPLLRIPYFGNDFYSQTPVCLSLPLSSNHGSGWQYSTALFLGLNSIILLSTLYYYFQMFGQIHQVSSTMDTQKSGRETKVAKRMAVIIMTDLACWLPILAVGIVGVSGMIEVPPDVHLWIAAFVLPINSAVNPYIYTLSDPRLVKNVLQRLRWRNGPHSEKRSDTKTTRTSTKTPEKNISDISDIVLFDDPGSGIYQTLEDFIEGKPQISLKAWLRLVSEVAQGVKTLDDSPYGHGMLDLKHIVVHTEEGNHTAFVCLGDSVLTQDDGRKDILAMGIIFRKILQITAKSRAC